jgi:hypothetical protein
VLPEQFNSHTLLQLGQSGSDRIISVVYFANSMKRPTRESAAKFYLRIGARLVGSMNDEKDRRRHTPIAIGISPLHKEKVDLAR